MKKLLAVLFMMLGLIGFIATYANADGGCDACSSGMSSGTDSSAASTKSDTSAAPSSPDTSTAPATAPQSTQNQ